MAICKHLSGVDLDGNLVKVECIKHECNAYKNIPIKNVSTNESVDKWLCEDTWVLELLMDNTRHQIGTQAAVESFRNEMAKDNRAVLKLAYNEHLRVN